MLGDRAGGVSRSERRRAAVPDATVSGMAFQIDSGVEVGTEQDIDRTRIQLWCAKIEESGALGAAGECVLDPESAKGASTS